jgi:DNA-binding transcriptional ArsR family regulator
MKMKRRLQIAQHVNPVDEAIILLYMMVNKVDFPEALEKSLDVHPADREIYQERYNIIMTIYHNVKEHLAAQKDRIEYYFKSHNDNFLMYGILSILWDYNNPNNSLPEYKEGFQDISEADRVRFYAQIIDYDEYISTPKERLQTQSDLIAFLDGTSYDKAVKWEILSIFHQQEAKYHEVRTLLLEIIKLFENKYRPLIAKLERDFYDYWSSYQTSNDIIDTITKKLNVSWQDNTTDQIVMPTIFQSLGVGITIDEEDPAKQNIIRIGIMMDSDFIIASHKTTKEEVVAIGKLLSDKSKVDILERVSKKPCYGKELATELSLTTATISYHVNALIEKSLLKAEVNANKVYYSLNQEKLNAYLEDIKSFFIR